MCLCCPRILLRGKGLALRKKEGRIFLYSQTKKKEAATQRIFERVKNSLFRTEKLKPILSLLESGDDLSREELQELKKAVEEKLHRIKK
ncbi:MAG: BlaI/MecI/CopY family transcriptional regulator [Pseudobdellovibrionaceae bacterium]